MRTHVDHTLTYDFFVSMKFCDEFLCSPNWKSSAVSISTEKLTRKSADKHFRRVAATHPLTVNQSFLLRQLIITGRSCRSEGRRVRWVDNSSSSSSSTNTLFVQSSVCNASLSLSHSPSGRIAPPPLLPLPPPPSPKGGHFQLTVKVGVFTHRPLRPLWLTAGTRTAAMADEALINRLRSAN